MKFQIQNELIWIMKIESLKLKIIFFIHFRKKLQFLNLFHIFIIFTFSSYKFVFIKNKIFELLSFKWNFYSKKKLYNIATHSLLEIKNFNSREWNNETIKWNKNFTPFRSTILNFPSKIITFFQFQCYSPARFFVDSSGGKNNCWNYYL